jgi:hypothetical protein
MSATDRAARLHATGDPLHVLAYGALVTRAAVQWAMLQRARTMRDWKPRDRRSGTAAAAPLTTRLNVGAEAQSLALPQ